MTACAAELQDQTVKVDEFKQQLIDVKKGIEIATKQSKTPKKNKNDTTSNLSATPLPPSATTNTPFTTSTKTQAVTHTPDPTRAMQRNIMWEASWKDAMAKKHRPGENPSATGQAWKIQPQWTFHNQLRCNQAAQKPQPVT